MKDLFTSILYSIPVILHMKQSIEPGLLSPGGRQDRKAMKEREKQQRALKHLPVLPGNLNMFVNMVSYGRPLQVRGGTPSKCLSSKQNAETSCSKPCTQPALHTQTVPQQLPGTVIWMMFSSSGSILICLIPPSSPEVPMGKGNGRQSPTGSSNATSAQHSTNAGKVSPASTSVPSWACHNKKASDKWLSSTEPMACR